MDFSNNLVLKTVHNLLYNAFRLIFFLKYDIIWMVLIVFWFEYTIFKTYQVKKEQSHKNRYTQKSKRFQTICCNRQHSHYFFAKLCKKPTNSIRIIRKLWRKSERNIWKRNHRFFKRRWIADIYRFYRYRFKKHQIFCSSTFFRGSWKLSNRGCRCSSSVTQKH